MDGALTDDDLDERMRQLDYVLEHQLTGDVDLASGCERGSAAVAESRGDTENVDRGAAVPIPSGS
jgi:hypothetical protein